MTGRCDLHVHTTASDGTASPTEAVRLAAQAGLCAIAVTDHDTAEGVGEALHAGAAAGIEVIPGIELSVDYQGYGIHLLGYFLDPHSPALCALLDWVIAERKQRNGRIAAAMRADGIDLTVEELKASYPDSVVGRPHFAAALVKRGLARDVKDAFDRYLSIGQVYFRKREYIPMDRAFSAIAAAGGKAVFAHPLQYRFGEAQLLALTQTLADHGAVGMECIYTGYTEAQVAYLRSIAAHYGLCVTGGSDFHGARKVNALGQPPVDAALLEALRAR